MIGYEVLDSREVSKSDAHPCKGTVFTIRRDGFAHDFEVFLPKSKDPKAVPADDLEAYFVELAKRDPEYRAWDEARKQK